MYSAIRASKTHSNENFTRQGSLRRVLHSNPKENLFGRQNEDLNKLYKRFHQEYVILAEYKMIQSENLQGIYVIPSRESPLVWFGVIFIRSGPYEDGIFRFNIVLDENFPDSNHPKVVFVSEIYHPVINNENELNLLNAFPTWNKTEQHLWQILKYIHWIFYNINNCLNHATNQEAVDLYRNNQDAFNDRVRDVVKSSQDHIYDAPPTDDKHYFVFERYNPDVHDAVKNSMLAGVQQNETQTKGHSWVMPGSFKPLSRPPSPDSVE